MRVIITGGNRGIGRAIAAAVDEAAIVGRDEASLRASGLPWARADVTDRAALHAALDELEAQLGGVDALVACAGASGSDWDEVIATNLTGAYRAAEWATLRRPRALVFISSIAAYSGGSRAGAAAYAAAKAGVLGLMRGLARELAPDVTVNAVAPGFIAGTGFFGGADPSERLVPQIPAGRAGHVDDVAGAVAYLLHAPYVHGQVLHVNGGWYFGG